MKIVPITHTHDEAEALMRVKFSARARQIREDIKNLLDAEYLYSPNLSVDDTRRIGEHFRDAIKSLESGMCYIRPEHPTFGVDVPEKINADT